MNNLLIVLLEKCSICDKEYIPNGQTSDCPHLEMKVRRLTEEEIEFISGIREGIKARKEGRMRPWSEIKEELCL